ncbi:hypothetical protein LMH73_015605 [Vibrio splendidus]|nr:hypothetical protein [Vibrio splendidus]MCC4882909.1 hypothetical protein [Vibrio splendidus]
MTEKLTITEAIKKQVVDRARVLGCDLVAFWEGTGVPMTLGNSETLFRTPSYVTHFEDHDWVKVVDLVIGNEVALA